MQYFNYRKVVWFIFLCIMIIIVFLPIYFMFKYSISDRASIVTGGGVVPLWPYSPTVKNYTYVLGYPDFMQAAGASLNVALLTICISILLGAPAAYVLARYKVPGKAVLLVGLISVRLFPDIVSIIPVTVAFYKFSLNDTYIGAALAHSLLSMPYIIYILKGVFESIPADLESQAYILGASKIYTFLRIILPLSATGMAAAAIYTFLLSWDEFIFSYFLLGMGDIKTLPLYLKQKMIYAPSQSLLMTIAMFLSFPVILFTIVLQKYMKSGVTSGAVK